MLRNPSPARTAAWPREKMFWALVAALALGQLVAFWMLCSYQVRSAHARNETLQVERMALADCLRHGHAVPPQHCAARLGTRHDPEALMAASENTAHIGAASHLSMGTATRVNFSLR
jgi:hypothetical protein